MISEQIYKFFSDYVYKHTGILYKENDFYRLDSRINTLIKHFDVPGPDELYQLLAKEITPPTHDLLVDLFTNNETYFMRDLKPFKAFAKGIIPKIKEEGNLIGGVSLWSCASSTGQEIYSIQMALDTFGDPADLKTMKIDASDISKEALKKAKEGSYTGLEVQRGLPAPLLIKYFEKSGDGDKWVVKSDLRARPNFFEFNLLKGNFPASKYHVIFCRNVLIYQDMDNKRQILESIYQSLKPGGFLVFGAGESMIGVQLPFEHVEIEGAWFYRKKE